MLLMGLKYIVKLRRVCRKKKEKEGGQGDVGAANAGINSKVPLERIVQISL
jgi:hypothetical protein